MSSDLTDLFTFIEESQVYYYTGENTHFIALQFGNYYRSFCPIWLYTGTYRCKFKNVLTRINQFIFHENT